MQDISSTKRQYSYASKEMNKIVTEREGAYGKVLGFLNIDFKDRITLVLFNDNETKFNETGHRGNGWAYDMYMKDYVNEMDSRDIT